MSQKNKKRSSAFFHSRFLAIMSIAVVLFLLGTIGIIEFVGRGIGNSVREDLSFNLLLSSDMDETQAQELQRQIAATPFVKDVSYISADQALEEMKKELGEDDPAKVLGYNPLQAEMCVHLKAQYTHPDSLKTIDSAIRTWNGVDNLEYRADMFDIVHRNTRRIGLVLLALSALLLLISYIQINNTTRLLIYSKRFSIRTMTLVGATPRFIRKPFVRYSMLNGLVAALLAILLLGIALYATDEYAFNRSLRPFLTMENLLTIAGGMLLVGILISAFSARAATNKYIRMDGGKMHLV